MVIEITTSTTSWSVPIWFRYLIAFSGKSGGIMGCVYNRFGFICVVFSVLVGGLCVQASESQLYNGPGLVRTAADFMFAGLAPYLYDYDRVLRVGINQRAYGDWLYVNTETANRARKNRQIRQ